MTRDALIGCTGFVGSNLLAQRPFDVLVNSQNSEDARGGTFGHVVFSAARAEKWRANADPAADAAHIDDLIELVSSITCDRLTLVSTVDVFRVPDGVDEWSAVPLDGLHAYGLGRRRLEQAVQAAHPEVLVVRLPGLFGPGLKKNVVFDLQHAHEVEKIQPASSFQFYDLTRLAADLDRAWEAGLPLVHLVPEPIRTADIVDRVLGREPLPWNAGPVARYDVRTRHSAVFDGTGPYLENTDEVVRRMRAFLTVEEAR